MVDPLEQIARDVRVLRRIVELVVALVIVGVLALWLFDAFDVGERPRASNICEQIPDLSTC